MSDRTTSKFDLEPNPFEQSFATTKGSDKGDKAQTQQQQQHAQRHHHQQQPQVAGQQHVPQQSHQMPHPGQPGVRIISSGAGGQIVATPGGRRHILPPVAALASPSALLADSNQWSNSLKTGPLSPALLQGPQNENGDSILRTGLTPGGGGSMFPTPGPATAMILGLTTDGLQGTNNNSSNNNGSNGLAAAATAAWGKPDPANAAVNGLYMLSQGEKGNLHNNSNNNNNTSNNNTALSSANNSVTGTPTMTHMSTPDKENEQAAAGGKRGRKDESATATSGGSKRGKRGGGGAGASKKEDDMSDSSSDKKESDSSTVEPSSKRSRQQSDEEKRKSFLERNRIAALKCRQRKKQWLASLQDKVEQLTGQNEDLIHQLNSMQAQMSSLKAILRQHKDCSIGLPPDLLIDEFATAAPQPGQPVPVQAMQQVQGPQQVVPAPPQGPQAMQQPPTVVQQAVQANGQPIVQGGPPPPPPPGANSAAASAAAYRSMVALPPAGPPPGVVGIQPSANNYRAVWPMS